MATLAVNSVEVNFAGRGDNSCRRRGGQVLKMKENGKRDGAGRHRLWLGGFNNTVRYTHLKMLMSTQEYPLLIVIEHPQTTPNWYNTVNETMSKTTTL
jgi:hypothetical protein